MEQPRLVSHCLRLELSNSTEHHGLAVEGSEAGASPETSFSEKLLPQETPKATMFPSFQFLKLQLVVWFEYESLYCP